MKDHQLMDCAKKARSRAYAPYSNYFVGAALLSTKGNVYQGCNIENASFSATVCAERAALFNAISQGEREFTAIALAGGPSGQLDCSVRCSPCGVCRQVLSEFCQPDFKVILLNPDNTLSTYLLSQLLPLGFSAKNL